VIGAAAACAHGSRNVLCARGHVAASSGGRETEGRVLDHGSWSASSTVHCGSRAVRRPHCAGLHGAALALGPLAPWSNRFW
jgi:hypothetical protein